MPRKKFIVLLLIAFLLGDLAYSFFQFLQFPLDGDMAGGIVPANDVLPILNDPFGWKVLSGKEVYPNPNRFFCHYPFYVYFNHIPFFLHAFLHPIEAVYVSVALLKTGIQLSLIYLLATIISGTYSVKNFRFLFAAALVTPLFQTNGYQGLMGIIDPAVTYAFFYALPTIFVIAYFLPLYMKEIHQLPFNINYRKWPFYILFAAVVALSGVLNPGIILVSVTLYTFHVLSKILKKKQFTKDIFSNEIQNYHVLFLLPATVFSLYSLYLGTFNSVNSEHPYQINELFSRLPKGIAIIFSEKIGPPLLLAFIIVNTLIIRYSKQIVNKKKYLNTIGWITAFAIIYICLLPFGGYRSYRPNVIRYDTFLPVMLCLFVYFGMSSLHILHSTIQYKKIYSIALAGLLILFTLADEPEKDKNACEKEALYALSQTQDTILKLQSNCRIASWEVIRNPNESDLNARLFHRWKISHENVTYYSEP